jgi:hypothetical protein
MYVVLDKEKPCIGSIRGLNLAAVHRKHKRLKLGGGQAYDRSADYLSFGVVKLVKA